MEGIDLNADNLATAWLATVIDGSALVEFRNNDIAVGFIDLKCSLCGQKAQIPYVRQEDDCYQTGSSGGGAECLVLDRLIVT